MNSREAKFHTDLRLIICKYTGFPDVPAVALTIGPKPERISDESLIPAVSVFVLYNI